jgi:hypothetical protein
MFSKSVSGFAFKTCGKQEACLAKVYAVLRSKHAVKQKRECASESIEIRHAPVAGP